MNQLLGHGTVIVLELTAPWHGNEKVQVPVWFRVKEADGGSV